MKKEYYLIFLSIFGCQKKTVTERINNSLGSDTAVIVFPDIIHSEKKVDGKLIYNFDEYNKYKNNIGTGKVSRYIHLYVYVDSFLIKDINEFNYVKKDTFLTQDINKINFKVKVNGKGRYYINTMVKDIVIFDTVNQDLHSPAKISEIMLSKEIFVK